MTIKNDNTIHHTNTLKFQNIIEIVVKHRLSTSLFMRIYDSVSKKMMVYHDELSRQYPPYVHVTSEGFCSLTSAYTLSSLNISIASCLVTYLNAHMIKHYMTNSGHYCIIMECPDNGCGGECKCCHANELLLAWPWFFNYSSRGFFSFPLIFYIYIHRVALNPPLLLDRFWIFSWWWW